MNQGSRSTTDRIARAHADVLEAAPFIDAPFLFRDLDH